MKLKDIKPKQPTKRQLQKLAKETNKWAEKQLKLFDEFEKRSRKANFFVGRKV